MRFVVELIREILANHDVFVEVVSHGQALSDYRGLLSTRGDLKMLDIPPTNLRRTRGLSGFRGASRVNARFGLQQFHFEVPEEACRACDVVWFPWLHRHRLPSSVEATAVASLHDVILLQFPGLVDARWRRDEYETVSGWLRSGARIAVSSRATAGTLAQIFGCTHDRTRVIPLSGQHGRPKKRGSAGGNWEFAERQYLICPANTMRHKNHEVLFAGSAKPSRPIRSFSLAEVLLLVGSLNSSRRASTKRDEGGVAVESLPVRSRLPH